jgi:hypothetical protein
MKFLFACLIALALGNVAQAQSTSVAVSQTTSATLSITIQFAPLVIAFSPASPTEACNTAAGTVVAAVSTTGGDGNAVTLSLTGGDTTDFALSGSNIVVGPNGIAAANCDNKVHILTVQAVQP